MQSQGEKGQGDCVKMKQEVCLGLEFPPVGFVRLEGQAKW